MIQYSTNLTDKQWQVIEKIINTQERKRKHSLRNIMNAILYLLKTGCQWRMIPKDFAPWESVYYYFSKWKNEGIIEELLDKLRSKVRIMAGRKESPSLGIIDSRSVKTSHHVDSDRGLDGNKKIKGRKQHIIVDAQGNLMAIADHEANVHDITHLLDCFGVAVEFEDVLQCRYLLSRSIAFHLDVAVFEVVVNTVHYKKNKIIMVTKEIVQEASNKGLEALKILFEKLNKEDVLKAIGILVISGVGIKTIEAIKEIVKDKV